MHEVQARLEDADAGGGGRARLSFAPVAAMDRPAWFTVRGSDPATPWLGPAGWQVAEHRFHPLDVEHDGQTLTILVGHEVVDAIPEFAVVEIQLPDYDIACKVSWEGVVPSYGPAALAPVAPRPPRPQPPPVPDPDLPPLPVRAAPVLFAFVVTPERRVVLRALDPSLTEPPPRPEPGEGVAGVAFETFARAFRGTLLLGQDGQGRIVGRAPDGPPERLRFRVTPGGDTVVQALDGHAYGEQIVEPRPDSLIFGLPHTVLAEAGQGELVLDQDRLMARLVPDQAGVDPLPERPHRRSLLVPLLGVAVVLCVGGATILLW